MHRRLFNGVSQGRQLVEPFEKATFYLPIAPGNVTALARRKGLPWGADSVVTPSAPASISLEWEWPVPPGTIRADGQDAALLVATVLDAEGRVVHESHTPITFTVAGAALLGAGNGDPSDHTPEGRTGSPTRLAYDGTAKAIIGAAKSPGRVQVTASAPGLKSATAALTATPYAPPFPDI